MFRQQISIVYPTLKFDCPAPPDIFGNVICSFYCLTFQSFPLKLCTETWLIKGVSSWCNCQSYGRRNHSEFELLSHCLLSDKYAWERHGPPYPPRHELNSTTTVLLEGGIWHSITYKGRYAVRPKKQNLAHQVRPLDTWTPYFEQSFLLLAWWWRPQQTLWHR